MMEVRSYEHDCRSLVSKKFLQVIMLVFILKLPDRTELTDSVVKQLFCTVNSICVYK